MSLPSTPALRLLRERGVPFTVHQYEYVEKGGTKRSSDALGLDEHRVVKTMVFEDEQKRPLIVLMHGDRQVSAKELARVLNVKKVGPCAPDVAQRHTGYLVGGTSPFGTKKALPVYVESTILELPSLIINGGGRGLLVEITPADLHALLSPTPVSVAT